MITTWSMVERTCEKILLVSVCVALVTWGLGMSRKSFGATPALLWVILISVSLVCSLIIGVIEFTH
jgi:hypothetical protein